MECPSKSILFTTGKGTFYSDSLYIYWFGWDTTWTPTTTTLRNQLRSWSTR